MIKIGDEEYYSTIEICHITGKKTGTVQKYARNNKLKTIGEDSKHFFLWTKEDLNKYQEYLKTAKPGRPFNETFKEDVRLDSLYHRRQRAIKKGDEKLIALIEEQIETVKNKNKKNTQ